MVKDGLVNKARRIAAPNAGQIQQPAVACRLIGSRENPRHEGCDPFPGKAPRPAILADDRRLDLGLNQHLVAALELLRHEDARAGNGVGAGIDGQDIVNAGGAAKVEDRKSVV